MILIISTRTFCQLYKQWWKTTSSQTQTHEILRLWCSLQPWWSKRAICSLASWTKYSLGSASPRLTWFLVISSHSQNSEKDSSSSFITSSCIAPKEWSNLTLKDSRQLFIQSFLQLNTKNQNAWKLDWRVCGIWMKGLVLIHIFALYSLSASIARFSKKFWWWWPIADTCPDSSYNARFFSSSSPSLTKNLSMPQSKTATASHILEQRTRNLSKNS